MTPFVAAVNEHDPFCCVLAVNEPDPFCGVIQVRSL
jgi:hypothetical protein